MRFENLVQFLVPLTFLAIWAITSLFNRDAQPLPPRRVPPPGPDGPRGDELPRRDSYGRTDELAARSLTRAEPERPTPRPRPATARPDDDGIVILDESGRRTRRESRGRAPARGSAAVRPAASELSRTTLTVDMHRPGAVPLREMEGLAPLSSTSRPLTSTGHQPNLLPTEESGAPSTPIELAGVGGELVRRLANDPLRLRDAFIAGEVLLRPPLARRGRAPRRPRPTPPA